MTNEDFKELDKAMSKKIMQEFEGQTITSKCPDCKGIGCEYCDYDGKIEMQY